MPWQKSQPRRGQKYPSASSFCAGGFGARASAARRRDGPAREYLGRSLRQPRKLFQLGAGAASLTDDRQKYLLEGARGGIVGRNAGAEFIERSLGDEATLVNDRDV